MDNSLVTAGLSTTTLAIVYTVYKMCKKGTLKSNCCGKKMEVSVDLSTPESSNSNDSGGARYEDIKDSQEGPNLTIKK